MKTHSKGIKETAILAKNLITELSKEDRKKALILIFSGNLGAGKTAFTKAIAKTLGVISSVTSPTFVIMKNYKISPIFAKKFGFSNLVHIDAYRLEKPEELKVLGFKDLIENKENLIIIEWGEKLKKILPKEYKHIHFEFIDKNERMITHKK